MKCTPKNSRQGPNFDEKQAAMLEPGRPVLSARFQAILQREKPQGGH